MKHLCKGGNCGAITDGIYCPRCQAERDKDRATRAKPREKTAERGYGGSHRRWRSMILARDPICKRCKRNAATEADHIKPLSKGGDWSASNGQGLCKVCHGIKTREDQRIFSSDELIGRGGLNIWGWRR